MPSKQPFTSSDLRRFRGISLAALIAASIVVIAALALSSSEMLQGSPGPLSLPHRQAQLSCQDCHGTESPNSSCGNCHGPHPSSRSGHSRLAQEGRLLCSQCHRIHEDNGGVQILADGRLLRWGSGGEEFIEPLRAPVEFAGSNLPIVPAAACARCHDLDSPQDPISACLDPRQAELAGRRPSFCFDEHQQVGGSRDPFWEIGRQAAHLAPVAPTPKAKTLHSWLWLTLGAFVGLVVLGIRGRQPCFAQSATTAANLQAPELKRLPIINQQTCLGCHACVDACPFDVLEVKDYVATVARPSACCGLTLCEERCPNGSLQMGVGTKSAGTVHMDEGLQSEIIPGIYLAGDVTGLPLIRNAINQGAHAMQTIAKDLQRSAKKRAAREELVDVLIVGAGPAGISAALEAKSMGLSFVVLEQNSVAGSIQSFPRNKLVFDQPLTIPLIGSLWLEQSTKEELLRRWMRIVREEKLDVREGLRVHSVEKKDDCFAIVTLPVDVDGEARNDNPVAPATRHFHARRVLLAIGTRGSPRRLPIAIPAEAESKVHYSLTDARSFAGQKVIIVGLGDVAMEAAIALAHQPDTQVTVVHRGNGFQRGNSRNIEEIQRLSADGRIDLLLESEVRWVDRDSVGLSSASNVGTTGTETTVECNALFVLIGNLPPTQFLRQVGVLAQEAPEKPSKSTNSDQAHTEPQRELT